MRPKLSFSKMSQDLKERHDDLTPPPLARNEDEPEEEHFPKPMLDQPSIEKLHQQRQKCELKRLLKHTHPELKMLDEAVDDELAEVLGSQPGMTGGDKGYEGEVFSRRLLFENCALNTKESDYSSKMNMTDGLVHEGDVSKKSALFERHAESPCQERGKEMVHGDKSLGPIPDLYGGTEEEMVRIDVQASRRIFESQSVKTQKPQPEDRFIGKASKFRADNGPVKTQKHDLESSGTDAFFSSDEAFEDDLAGLSDSGRSAEMIATSADIFRNNPFISANVEKENSHLNKSKPQIPAADPSGTFEDHVKTNVKNRAHLFESMPFDQIRHQNKDDIETMVENIRETLNTLHGVKAISSDGLIIEVSETMMAKKAKFTLLQSGPEIDYDEVAEGGAQNFIVHLLPRSNLKPQITYLKEDREGNMDATVVAVPLHQHHFTSGQESEFKTANVAQVVEDILHQDNSLRRGVILQKDADNCAEVIVYSLYNYFDEKDIKRYTALEYDQPEREEIQIRKTETQTELRKGIVESTINCLLETPQDQSCSASLRPEITVKGNVKLFMSCIEKGDLDYLKSLQAEAETQQEPELPVDQTKDEQSTQFGNEEQDNQAQESLQEWVPVDVKRLRSMFSADQKENNSKQVIRENYAQTSSISHAHRGGSTFLGKSQSSAGYNDTTMYIQHPGHFDFDTVHQAEMVQVVNNIDEITNLQTAINNLQQVTMEAKTLHHASQNKEELPVPELLAEPMFSEVTDKENKNQKHKVCPVNSDQAEPETVVDSQEAQQEPSEQEEVIFEGKFQKALESLEKFNINVTRGDFKTAMVYTMSSRPQKEEEKKSFQGPGAAEFCPVLDDGKNLICSNQEDMASSKNVIDGPEQKREPREEDEVNFQRQFQEALDSLEKSNVNVTRGDFKTAMIYKTSSRDHFVQNLSSMTDSRSTQNFGTSAETLQQKREPEEEVNFQGKFQEALESLQKSHVNVSKGDFKTAMIYKGSSSLHREEEASFLESSTGVQKEPENVVQGPQHKCEQEKDEVYFQGKLQEALDSLGKCDINVTRGDFKTAMIYQNSSRLQNVEKEFAQKLNVEGTESRPSDNKPMQPIVDQQEFVEVPHQQREQDENEVVFHGKLQEAIDSLEKSNINVTRGDFKTAMIYNNSSRHNKTSAQTSVGEELSTVKMTPEEVTEPKGELQNQRGTLKKPATDEIKPSKPVIPPKPEHLKAKHGKNQSDATQKPNLRNVSYPVNMIQPEAEIVNQDSHGTINNQRDEINITAEVRISEEGSINDGPGETSDTHIDFREACQKFGGKTAVRNAPVKPKRVKIAQPEIVITKDDEVEQATAGPPLGGADTRGQTANKVEMREKRGRRETEDERRQRLSVHMDEIMRGNMTTAMEIIDNIRKQEELQNILSRVEEIEKDTSEADVSSMRSVFEEAPDWIVDSENHKERTATVENRKEKPLVMDEPQSKSSMAHIFGDLERASEEIMNLKEQTLARLMDIEESIKKALFSVSTLKSESDIAGLSCLFKESLGTIQGPPNYGNISKISIGSSKTQQAQESPITKANTAEKTAMSKRRRPSPPSSPAFISIQSAVRKQDKADAAPAECTLCPTCQKSPKLQEKFRTTKILTCNSPAQTRKGGQKQPNDDPLQPKRELSVLEVQTDPDGKSVIGTKMVTENFEHTDTLGNKFYLSKSSTVVTTQPQNTPSFAGHAFVSPAATYQVTYPEVRLPVNHKP